MLNKNHCDGQMQSAEESLLKSSCQTSQTLLVFHCTVPAHPTPKITSPLLLVSRHHSVAGASHVSPGAAKY